MSKLVDPSLPPGAIVEEYDDGGALRNDGVKLTPANKNPWYVLATIWGEQGEKIAATLSNEELAARNRDTWNKWAEGELDGDERAEVLKRFCTRLNNPQAELPDPSQPCNFSNLHFDHYLVMRGFVFNSDVFFDGAIFSLSADFSNATFCHRALFGESKFNSISLFIEANFCEDANFESAKFDQNADFPQAKFGGDAEFSNATFGRHVSFFEAKIRRRAFFKRAVFNKEAQFSSASFSDRTIFDQACFLTHVPEFFAAKLHDDTTFTLPDRPGDNWPPQSGEGVMSAKNQKCAYSRLRRFFADAHQVDEEQFFHRQEMRCKREMERGATRCLYSLYGLLSDYGISIWRPFGAIFGFWIIFALPMVVYLWAYDLFYCREALRAGFAWSAANMLPFTGFARTYVGYDFYACLPPWLKILGGAQTLLALPLLFLLGLGLRNTFRLR